MICACSNTAIFESMSQPRPARPTSSLVAAVVIFVCGLLFGAPVQAQSNGHTYDIDTLGIPRFVNTVYIDLAKITQLSRFRSNAGHEYSDSSQFGLGAYRGPPDNRFEACSSMKHYFIAPDATVKIYAPVSGKIIRMFDEPIGGTQIQIEPDEYPAFAFTIFHVALNQAYAVGDHVDAGQLIGNHTGSQTWSDIAVFVRTPRGNHLISYFETLTDEAFEAFRARGIQSREQLIYSREYRLANPVFFCLGRPTPQEPELVSLTGGAVNQTITVAGLAPSAIVNEGSSATIVATASSGLPVTITSRQPKVCSLAGTTVTWRRPGHCVISMTQAGDAGTFAAAPIEYTITVLPAGIFESVRRPRLGGIHPSFIDTTESYLIFHNESPVAGTVTVSLFNGDTGATVARWTSPALPARGSRQFQINDLENAATAPFVKPRVWGVRIEPESTMSGYMQHILFDRASVAITNASSCSGGLTANPAVLPYVYSSAFEDFPSTVLFNNPTVLAVSNGASPSAADTGVALGTFYPPTANNASPASMSSASIPFSTVQTRLNYAAAPENSRVSVRGNFAPLGGAYLQHVLESRRGGVLSDMNTACAINGYAQNTIPSPLYTASVYSGGNVGAQSVLRFYNAGTAPGPVTVALRDPSTGSVLAQWTSPPVAPGAQVQVPVATIEAETNAVPQSIYTATITSEIDGFFQHLVGRGPGSALANFSTCNAATTVDGATLIGVHATALAASGYGSTVIVNNTGAQDSAAMIDVFDARDGTLLATLTTDLIAANAQFAFDSGFIEARLSMLAGSAGDYYVLKLRSGFTGYLQHFVANRDAGVITDLTPMCRM